MNTRGKDLTLSDLVKSHLSRLLKPTNKGVDLARDQNEQTAAIGNLILVDQSLNNELANKSFNEKRLLLQSANVWVDAAILNAFNWGAAEIEARTKLLAAEAYSNVWKI